MRSSHGAFVRAMAAQLQLVVQREDWAQLQKLDLVLAQWLQGVGAALHDALSEAERELLLESHRAALQACAGARAQAAQRLHLLQTQQEAQAAYAWQEVWG